MRSGTTQQKMCIKFRFQSYLKRFLVINYELTARAVARKKLQPGRSHGPLYEISRMKSSDIISLIKK